MVHIMHIFLITLLSVINLIIPCAFMPQKYKNVSLPQELYDKVEKLVESKEAGYVSVSEAVKDAVRELLRKHKLLP